MKMASSFYELRFGIHQNFVYEGKPVGAFYKVDINIETLPGTFCCNGPLIED